MAVSVRVFPSSNIDDWGRIFTERNVKGILEFITDMKAPIEGFDINVTGVNFSTSTTLTTNGGSAVFEGYQVECQIPYVNNVASQYSIPLGTYSTSNQTFTYNPWNTSLDSYYLCLRLKNRISNTNETTFIDYTDFVDMPTGFSNCPFSIVTVDSNYTGLEDTIPDNTNIESGYVYKYLPLYKFSFSSNVSPENVVDIRDKTAIALDKMNIGFIGNDVTEYFGFNADGSTTEKTNDWRKKYVLSTNGQNNSLIEFLYNYVNFINTQVRGFSNLDNALPTTLNNNPVWNDNATYLTLPISDSTGVGSSIIGMLRYVIDGNADYIKNRIIIPTVQKTGNTITGVTYSNVSMGMIATVDNNGFINAALLPTASNTSAGLVSVNINQITDTSDTYTQAGVLSISNGTIASRSPRYGISSIVCNSGTPQTVTLQDNNTTLNINGSNGISFVVNTSTRNSPIVNITIANSVNSAYGLEYDANLPTTVTGKTFFKINQNLLTNSSVAFNAITTNTITNATSLSMTAPIVGINGVTTFIQPTGFDSSNPLVTVNGDLTATRVFNAVYNDYAELFLKDNPYDEIYTGIIVGKIKGKDSFGRATKECAKNIVGVSSESYGHLIGGDGSLSRAENLKRYVPVALCGRVAVLVKGTVQEGDLITVSDEPGIGERVDSYIPGTVVGKSLETKNYDKLGLVMILVSVM